MDETAHHPPRPGLRRGRPRLSLDASCLDRRGSQDGGYWRRLSRWPEGRPGGQHGHDEGDEGAHPDGADLGRQQGHHHDEPEAGGHQQAGAGAPALARRWSPSVGAVVVTPRARAPRRCRRRPPNTRPRPSRTRVPMAAPVRGRVPVGLASSTSASTTASSSLLSVRDSAPVEATWAPLVTSAVDGDGHLGEELDLGGRVAGGERGVPHAGHPLAGGLTVPALAGGRDEGRAARRARRSR